jgi:hypothetical protein
MSWLNTSDAFVLDTAVHDRVAELRSTSDVAHARFTRASATRTAGTPRAEPCACPRPLPTTPGTRVWRRARAACL